MGQQLAFYVNQEFCMGCKTCQVACKDKHDLEVGENFRRVTEVCGGGFSEIGSTKRADVFAFYVSISCNHCEEPRCVANCPTGAMRKNPEDGVVSIDAEVCMGCRYCTWSCPYAGPQYSPAKGKTQKCDLCADYRAKGKEPACIAACPMRAVEFGTVEELTKKHPEAVNFLQGLPDGSLTRPTTLFTPHRHALTGAGGQRRG